MSQGDVRYNVNLVRYEQEIQKIWAEICVLRDKSVQVPLAPVTSVNGLIGQVVLSSTLIPEGVNLYYTDARVQAFSDVRYALKNHTHPLAQITDFPVQTGQAGKVLLTDGTTPYWGTVPAGYTDADVKGVVSSMFTNSPSVQFVYNGGTGTFSASVLGYKPADWDTAYQKRITAFALQSGSGTTSKTLRITLADGSYFDASFDDKATNNYTSSLSFDPLNGNLTLGRSGMTNLVTNLDGRYMQALQIVDSPTIDLSTADGKLKADLVVGDFDQTAESLLVYAGGTIKRRSVSSIAPTTEITEIAFEVGQAGFPQSGEDTYTPLDEFGNPLLIGKTIRIFREGDMEYQKSQKGYSLDPATGTITFYPTLYLEETIIIWVFDSVLIKPYDISGGITTDGTDILYADATTKIIL